MDGPGTKSVDNETDSSSTRFTKAGKRLTYQLTVLQQPHRARACGSGAKSSADRRPVDPPPIVELKIFEGEGSDAQDVTFSFSANYFLFATLENARNIAQSRGGPPQAPMPVLTGTPVAGIVYLERPKPAGYFIFPDLSVRHEGKYRLSFSLYEELKDHKDEDQDGDSKNLAGDAHVTHRLEVKSVPFTVYSAKKFPGLTESTALSRVVAEQGCRVRIRRDVRMRRRDAKGKDWDGYEDETADARARMSATPDGAGYPSMSHAYGDPIARPRSDSNASHHSVAQTMVSRRTSTQEMQPQGYYPSSHGTAPHTPQTSYAQSSPYGPTPGQQQYAQATYMPQQSMQPPPPQYSHPSYHAAPAAQPMAPAPQSQGYYGYGAAPAPATQMVPHSYGPPAPSYGHPDQDQRISVDYSTHMPMENRRSSAALHIPPPPPPPPTSTSAQFAVPQPQPYQPAPPANTYHHLHEPSIGSMSSYSGRPAPAEPPVRPSGVVTPLSARPSFNDKLPSINTQLPSINTKYLEPESPASAIAPPGYPSSAVQTPVDSHKRGFGQVFNDSHLNNPLRQGARPSDAATGSSNSAGFLQSADDDNDGDQEFHTRRQMIYRRANGRQIARHLPVHS